MKTMDGNNAAAWASYPFTEVAAIYPITPSSVMAEVTDQWAAKGKENLFGTPVKLAEMQSEAVLQVQYTAHLQPVRSQQHIQHHRDFFL